MLVGQKAIIKVVIYRLMHMYISADFMACYLLISCGLSFSYQNFK